MYGRSFSSCSDSCMGRKHGTLWKKLTDMKLACLGNKRKTHSACLRNKRKKQDAGKIACLRYKRKKRTEKQGKRGGYVCEIKGKKQFCLIPFISETRGYKGENWFSFYFRNKAIHLKPKTCRIHPLRCRNRNMVLE